MTAPSRVPAEQLLDEEAGVVEFPQGLQHTQAVNGNVPGLLLGVDEVAHQAVPIAVEVEADQLAGAVENRAAGIAADGVGGRDEVKRSFEIDLVLALAPAFRQ